MTMHQLFDGSRCASLPSGILECAAYLRRYNDWRRGGLDSQPDSVELGVNLDFAVAVLDAMSGHDHLMVIAATRYCLGRMTYVVGECAAWLIKIWPLLSEQTKAIVQRDIEEAFARDDADRADGRERKALGWDSDRREWERVRKLWSDAS